MKKKKRVVIYCRAELPDVDGNTLEKQSARLRGLAELSNMAVVGEVFEYGNGIASQRPGWEAMSEAAVDAFNRGLEFIAADDEQSFYLFINTWMWLERWKEI